MKKYELMTIYKAELGEEGAKELSSKVQENITANSGTIVSTNFWGRRKFAYELEHQKEGFYDVVDFEIESTTLPKFENKMKLMNGIVRYLITAQS